MASQDVASGSMGNGAHSRLSLARCIDSSAPLFIAKSTLFSGVAGGLLGASVGIVQSINPVALAMSLGVRWFVTTCTFFGLREYLVSPLLIANQATSLHTRRFHEIRREPITTTVSINEMRTARLLDSALTGSLGGPIIVFFRDTLARMGYASPSRSVLRAGLTCAVITSSLQLVVNQTRITRVRYLARKEGSTSPPIPVDPSEAVEASTTAQIRTALENPVKGPDGEVLGEKSLPARIMSTMSTFLPIRKISDEEYLSALERRRQAMDERIAEIESEEGRMYDAMTRDAKS